VDKIVEFAVEQPGNDAQRRANRRAEVKHMGILRRRLAEGPSTCQKSVELAANIYIHLGMRMLNIVVKCGRCGKCGRYILLHQGKNGGTHLVKVDANGFGNGVGWTLTLLGIV